MAYNINKSNSDPVTIPSSTIDNQFDIPLVGPDAINWGDDIALAFVRLLENFAADNAPAFGSARTAGQLWYDTSVSSLKVYNGSTWVSIANLSEVVQNTGNETIAGVKTFSGSPVFDAATPFAITNNALVTNLNADLLDSQEGTYYDVRGKQTMYIPASVMYAQTTNGAAPATVELTANQPMINVFDFDQTTQEAVQFELALPKEWNEGTITYQVFWTSGDTNATDVIWGLQGVSITDDGAIDTAFGTAITVTDTNKLAANDLSVSAESGAVTITGAAVDTLTYFRLYRDAAAGGDTLAADARLLGVKIFYTTDATNSA